MLPSIFTVFLLLCLSIKIDAAPFEQLSDEMNKIPLKFFVDYSGNGAYPFKPIVDLPNTYMIGAINRIGTPKQGELPQKLAEVIFTLSSGDFWVQNAQARKALNCSHDNEMDAYDPNNSTSYSSTDQHFQTISFKGYVRGKVVKDFVNFVGNITGRSTFGHAHYFSCFFVEQGISGEMGLGWPQIANPLLSPTPFYNALQKMPNKMFSLHINSGNKEGSISFGKFNVEEYEENGWEFTPVSKRGFWQFATTGFYINSNVPKEQQQAILLESVLFILGQNEDINRLTAELGPSAYFSHMSRTVAVDCKEFVQRKLPTVKFHLANGLNLVLAPEDYVNTNYAIIDFCPTYFAYKSDFFDKKATFMPRELDEVNWIFGQPIMAKYCTSFHFDQEKIGFWLAKKQ